MNRVAFQFSSETRSFARYVFDRPKVKPGEVLVRVTCCTICGSDIHTFSGRRDVPCGCVMGHEIIGEIEDWAGDDPPLDFYGNQLQLHQRVTWAMAVGCGHCFFCKVNLTQKCESLYKYGHLASGACPTGGFSENCLLVPGTPIFPVGESLADEVICPANCATATVSAALRMIGETHAIDRINAVSDSTVLIMGAGMLGLTAAAQFSSLGARQIMIVDPNISRLELATEFGATHCLATTDCNEIALLAESLTQGRGVDVCLDVSGITSAVESCIAAARIGGCVLLAGSVFPGPLMAIAPEDLVRRMLTIRGLHNYLPTDLEHALRFLEEAHHRYPFGKLVSRSFSLEQIQEAFEYAVERQPVRVAIRP